MTRRLTIALLLTVIASAGFSGEVSAGWKGLKKGKIRIPKPGPYQQKIINGAFEGYQYGSGAGSVVGPAGQTIGGIYGGIYGAAGADHQHHSDKVHDFRTRPFPISFWNYGNAHGGGYFQRNGNQWVEMKGGRYWATFRQTGQSSDSVKLFDSSRNIEVLLQLDRAFWRTPGGSWNYLFHRIR